MEASYSAGVGAESNRIEDSNSKGTVNEADEGSTLVQAAWEGGRSLVQWAGWLAANARNERLVIIV